MKIEKVCRYVPVTIGLKSDGVAAGCTTRHMLLSIPRVKFLENGDTDFYHKYKPSENNPSFTDLSHNPNWREKVKILPLTERELQVEKLLNDGATHSKIAKILEIERGSVANIINRLRVKRAHQALKAESLPDD